MPKQPPHQRSICSTYMLPVGCSMWVMFPAKRWAPHIESQAGCKTNHQHCIERPCTKCLHLSTFGHTASRSEKSIYKESNDQSQTPYHLIWCFVTKNCLKKKDCLNILGIKETVLDTGHFSIFLFSSRIWHIVRKEGLCN